MITSRFVFLAYIPGKVKKKIRKVCVYFKFEDLWTCFVDPSIKAQPIAGDLRKGSELLQQEILAGIRVFVCDYSFSVLTPFVMTLFISYFWNRFQSEMISDIALI